MNNSFLHPLGEVHFDDYKPEDAKEAVDHTLRLAKKRIRNLRNLPLANCTFDSVVLGLSRSDQELEFVVGIIMHLESMKVSVWADAKDYALRIYSKFSLEVQFDRKIYDKLIHVKQLSTDLEKHELRLLDKVIRNYDDNGIGLPIDAQKKLKQLSKKETKLCSQYKPNMMKAQEAHPLHVTDVSKLSGVRQNFIDTYAQEAKDAGKEGYLITVDDANFEVIMTSCSVKSTRREFHKIFSSSVATKNHKLLYNVLELRHEIAEILGYKTPGHMLMQNRMVKSPEDALKFVEDLMSKYLATAKKEYADLLAFVQSIEQEHTVALEQFEFDSNMKLYYPAKHFEHLYNLNIDETKEYFEFTTVRDFMFTVLHKLYSVRIEPVTVTSWHPSVEVYNVYDAANSHLAQVHCDWFARKDKHSHAWMNEFVLAERHTDKILPHIGCVVMNLSAPTKQAPTLLSIDAVETMWHEFGHFIHLAFSNTKLKEQSTMRSKLDFVEAPSQIMENWVLHKDILPQYAKHYKTGKPLSLDVVETVKKMSRYNVGLRAIRQLYFAYIDLKIHSSLKFNSPKEMADFARSAKEKYFPVATMSYYATLSTFGHLVGGYASGYYTYKWSESIQADMFSRFEKEGVLNPKVGEEYKALVLARGDEVDPDQLVRDFLGRDSTPEAMLRYDGIIS